MTRSTIIETMARGAYAFATGGMGWETATDITKGKMRELVEAALTALEASGMAVGWRFDMENAPKGDCIRFEPAEYRRGQLSLAARVVISNGAYPRKAIAWMPLPPPPTDGAIPGSTKVRHPTPTEDET